MGNIRRKKLLYVCDNMLVASGRSMKPLGSIFQVFFFQNIFDLNPQHFQRPLHQNATSPAPHLLHLTTVVLSIVDIGTYQRRGYLNCSDGVAFGSVVTSGQVFFEKKF